MCRYDPSSRKEKSDPKEPRNRQNLISKEVYFVYTWNSVCGMGKAMDDLTNLSLIEEKYAAYLRDPSMVDASWRYFFSGMEFVGKKVGGGEAPSLLQAYRRYGHLLAKSDPLVAPLEKIPELNPQDDPRLQKIYCGRVGFECTELSTQGLEEWIYERIEKEDAFQFSLEEKHKIAECLNRSEIFENFLHTKYLGQTRFSLEGHDALIPMLQELVVEGVKNGVKGFVLGMAHRGRLNVLTNILQKSHEVLFKEFEDTIPLVDGEGSDVKYHKGFSSDVEIDGKKIHLHLCANSSALESVDGIVLGMTKAKQILHQDPSYGAILIHGDAALAGQGVVYETLQMAKVDGFSTNGTIHIALDNRIGYTTAPEEARSTRYCTDIAKMFGVPVFHVNGEDPEGSVFAARLALAIRTKFQCDVFINLHGYRKYGHNEGDEPSFTQPLQYQVIRQKQSVRAQYLATLEAESVEIASMGKTLEQEFKEKLGASFEKGKVEEVVLGKHRFGVSWDDFVQPPSSEIFKPVATAVPAKTLKQLMDAYTEVPQNFQIHPKLAKWLQDRRAQLDKTLDWGSAECLAFSSLLAENIPIRLAGEDVKRGTFSQRHAVWVDQTSGAPYEPFMHLAKTQGAFHVHNTILSEYGALAFEFGYSWSHPASLVLWEAQYGDFDIGAQTIIDHYLVAGEQKWARYSSLVMLLPHGYEGAGPEHSSARPERFLQLCAGNNIQVVYPTTPAQYFHLLRRQALRKLKKPLVVLTPKSLLRLPVCSSALEQFTQGTFEEILDAPQGDVAAKTILFCSGKIFYDLQGQGFKVPIIRIEQQYPFHREKFQKIGAKYKEAKTWIWVQEEPENMGAWEHLRSDFMQDLPQGNQLLCIARPRSGSTATGSRKKHLAEQTAIFEAVKKRIHEC